MRLRLLCSTVACIVAESLGAQQPTAGQPDVLRGRVTDDSARAVIATVIVTRGPDRFTQRVVTDSTGRYQLRFDEGTGDYLIYVSATGFKPVRRRVTRQSTEREFVADFSLTRDLTTLATVKVTADKPARASNDVDPMTLETGAAEQWRSGVNGQIPPTMAGDLGAIAGMMSNVTMTAAGPTILGAGAESNLTTLNGMGFAAGSIPRAARTETRVTGATFDPTRGGFSGANVDVRLGAGDRFYQQRNAFLTLNPPAWQLTDAVGRALGAPSGGVTGSVGADGELIRQALTYNVALDVTRTGSSPTTLLYAQPDALTRAGVAPDSVARLLSLAGPLGAPLSGTNVPATRQQDGITWLGRLDDTRDTLQTRALSTYFGLKRSGGIGFAPLAAPSASGERSDRTVGAQLTLGAYVGEGQRILTETRFAASSVQSRTSPYRAVPAAQVLVRSSSADATNDVTSLTLGGAGYLPSDDTRWTMEASNETSWNAGGRRHRFKSLVWGRADGIRQEGNLNGLGTFAFNSIADFEAGRAASFTRTLSQPVRSGRVWNVATALAHTYAPSHFVSVLYGARLEADGFFGAPEVNPALEQALGVVSGAAPARVHVSPRLGFSYQYNRTRDNGPALGIWNVGRFFRYASGTIRGGIGEFRDLLRPGTLADASASTGLAGGTSALSCVGSAVPTVDWFSLSAEGAIPTQCLGGSGVLADRAPSVSLIDPSYDTPRSWRASLDWSTELSGLMVKVGALGSYDLSQPGVVDANFKSSTALVLPNEGNRPVYVTAASIDPSSGTVSAVESRRTSQFGSVLQRVSDLRGYGQQLSVTVAPDLFNRKGRLHNIMLSTSYTLQQSRRQFRGFDGGGFGDPRAVEWAAGPNDARHIAVITGGFSSEKIGTVTFSARAQSGLPFTPIVQGDVNGDGRWGDRAFIPDPSAPTTDAALAAEIRALLANGSSSARNCVEQYLAAAADRNGCRGPWTHSLNAQWTPSVPARWSARVHPSIYFQNVLSGVDQLLHGAENARGWGAPAMPDPVLLVPHGFDASGPSFRYDVNPRFADTRPGHTLLREPFRVALDVSFELSTNFDLQQLRRAVEPVKNASGWQRRSADSLTAFYLSRTSSIHKLLLQESDSLFLSAAQIIALRRADSVYSDQVRAVYRPLGQLLADSHGAATKAELDSVQATSKTYWKIFWAQPEIADSIVTPVQRELIPMFKTMLSIPKSDREHSQWRFGSPVTLVDKPKPAR
jgi:hypothetical protein